MLRSKDSCISNFLWNRPDFNIPNIDDFKIFVFCLYVACCLSTPPFACAHNKWTRFKFQTGNVYSFGRWNHTHVNYIRKPIVLLLVGKKYTFRVITRNFCEITQNFSYIYLQKEGGGLSCTFFVINHDEFDEFVQCMFGFKNQT